VGLGIDQIEIALLMREKFVNKSVIVVSVQYPPSYDALLRLARQRPELINQEEITRLSKSSNQNFYKEFFSILGAKIVESVDVTNEEGAEHLRDLALPLASNDSLKGAYDWVIEGGTAEHVSNPAQYFMNVLEFLRPGGFYLLSLPSSNMMEHGFYQFSPTLFADLVYANRSTLRIEHLSLVVHDQNFILHSLYKDTMREDRSAISQVNVCNLNRKRFHDLGILTGTMINSANRAALPVSITALIAKNNNNEIKFSFMQGEYRRKSLSVICPDDRGIQLKDLKFRDRRVNLKLLVKRIVIASPIPMNMRIYLYKMLNFIVRIFEQKSC
jgi:hypothetical protein